MGPLAVAVARIAGWGGVVPRQGADCIQVPVRHGPVRLVTAGWVRAAHRAGLRVHVWTVDAEREMHDLLDLGVDGLMTDRPRALRSVFLQRGLAWPSSS
jgi:glycerophosphoryl diester phosphodiesterase